MTLRELIRGCSHASMFNFLRLNYYSDESNNNLIEYSVKYRRTCSDLISLPDNPNSALKIYITEPNKGEDNFIDVCLLNKDDDELFAMDMVPWEDLIDMEIYKAVDLNNNESLAHILWEITFWGWNPDEVLEERRKLLEATKDPHPTEWIGWEDDLQ